MSITLTYQSGKGASFGGIMLLWGYDRKEVRRLLTGRFEVADSIIDMSQYHNGDSSHNIIQRRDIYENYKGQDNLFFLNYDTADKLFEIEVHHGLDICINGVVLDFSMDIAKAVDLLEKFSGNKKVISAGNYFFSHLNMAIASQEAMGGEGDELSYFYCGRDTSHLMDEGENSWQ